MHRLPNPGTTLKAAAIAGALLLMPTTAALASAADTITAHERGVDVNPGDQNPCSGAIGTVIDVNDIHFHVTTLADGTVNENGHNTADVTFIPDDPTQPSYHGRETYAFSQNTNDRRTATTTSFHLRMKGSDGSFLTVREVAHLTIGPDGATASFDRPSLACL